MQRNERFACAVAALVFSSSSAWAQCSGSGGSTMAGDASPGAVAMGAVQGAKGDIVDTAVAAGNFKTLAAALTAADLVDDLKGAGPFTVFAPTDAAFAALPPGTLESLLKPENKAKLVAILTYHVVPGKALAADVVSRTGWSTLNGQRASISKKDGTPMIDGAKITATDIVASNGVIHGIDAGILPSNRDVVDTAVAAGSFKTLAAALKAAGLVDTLKGKGPFTVFAPTDAAFAKLPPGTLESLLKPENKAQLVKILTLHVVPGRVFSDQAIAAGTAKSVQGGPLAIAKANGGVTVNGAKVTAADLNASNGVIHVIDTVILPE